MTCADRLREDNRRAVEALMLDDTPLEPALKKEFDKLYNLRELLACDFDKVTKKISL